MQIYNPVLPIDRGWAWMVVAGGFFVNLIIPGLSKNFGVLYPHIQDTFGTSHTQTSWIGSALGCLSFALGPVASLLAERFSHRRVILCGVLLCMASLLGAAFTRSWHTLLLAYMFIGIGCGSSFVPSIVIVGKYFRHRRAIANGLMTSGGGLGGLVLPLLFSVILERYSLRGTFILLSGITSLCLVSAMLYRPLSAYARWLRVPLFVDPEQELSPAADSLKDTGSAPNYRLFGTAGRGMDSDGPGSFAFRYSPESLKPARSVSEGELYQAVDDKKHVTCSELLLASNRRRQSRHRSLPVLPDVATDLALSLQSLSLKNLSATRQSKNTFSQRFNLRALKSPAFLVYLCVAVLAAMAFNGLMMAAVPHAEDLGFLRIRGAAILSVIGGADLVGRVVVGLLTDLCGVRHTLAIACSLLLGGLSILAFSLQRSYASLLALGVPFGLVGGNWIPLLHVIYAEKVGVQGLAPAVGVTSLTLGGISLVQPFIGGSLRDKFGTWRYSLFLGATCMLLAGAIALFADLYTAYIAKRKRSDNA